jgi:nitrate/nitrite transporter NarK
VASAASPARALVLATISFAVSFVAWGLVGGLASVFTALYHLTASQTALLVAVVWPAAAVSAGGLALNVGLLIFLGRIERTRRIAE